MVDDTADSDRIDCHDLRDLAQAGGDGSDESGDGLTAIAPPRLTELRLIEPDGSEQVVPPLEWTSLRSALMLDPPSIDQTAEERVVTKRDEQQRARALAQAEEDKREAEQKAKREAQRLEKAEAEAQAEQQARDKARAEAGARSRREADEKARAAAAKAKLEAEKLERVEAARVKREARERERAEAAAKAKAEAEERARIRAAAKAKREAEEKAKREAEAEAKRAAEDKARREAEAKARREAEEKARQEAEAKAKADAAAKAKREAEEKAKAEAAAARTKAEAEKKAKAEAEEKAKREAEEQAKAQAAAEAKRESEEKAKAEADRKAKAQAEKKAKADAEKKAKAEAKKQRAAAAKTKKEAEEKARKEAQEAQEAKAEAKKQAEKEEREAKEQAKAEETAKVAKNAEADLVVDEAQSDEAALVAPEPPKAEPEPPADLNESFRRLIRATGPISLAQFMAESNARYYSSRDPLGEEGDFITAPEVSQMFGELIGLWFADLWVRMGARDQIHFVELGPGRATLAQDALRAAARYDFDPTIHFVEGSPALRTIQSEAFPQAIHHEDISTLPSDAPLLILANEFFDALPIHQLVRSASGWHERMIGLEGDEFDYKPGSEAMDHLVPPSWKTATQGTMIETSAAAAALMADIAQRLTEQGGAALIIDYGALELRAGTTLQALKDHEKVDPLAYPGEADLTAHVDFELLQHVARQNGADVMGVQMQGDWLMNMGIDLRREALQRRNPGEADKIKRQYDRLVDDSQMGLLFKVLGICGRRWPIGVGFE
ncbi:MAG: SAM-dependent methyltransferase [Erythrobacter sp.]|nr:SAM-dependent methyltransferase [Erythrobacter sp.]